MAMVLIERRMPTALVNVRNVFGLLSAVNTMITIRMAMTRPPMRRPAASARPDHWSRVVAGLAGWAGGRGALFSVIPWTAPR